MVYKYSLLKKTLDEDFTEINFVDFDVVSEVSTNKLVEEATDLLKLLILGSDILPQPSILEGDDVVEISINQKDLRKGVCELI